MIFFKYFLRSLKHFLLMHLIGSVLFGLMKFHPISWSLYSNTWIRSGTADYIQLYIRFDRIHLVNAVGNLNSDLERDYQLSLDNRFTLKPAESQAITFGNNAIYCKSSKCNGSVFQNGC